MAIVSGVVVPWDIANTIVPMVAAWKGQGDEAIFAFRGVHPIARDGVLLTEILHQLITPIVRPGVILAKRPQYHMIRPSMTLEVLVVPQISHDLLRHAVCTSAAIGASVRIQVPIQPKVIGDDEHTRLIRVQSAPTAPLHPIVQGAEETEVPRQK